MKKNRWIKTGADMVILLCSVILCVQIYFESHRLEQSLLIFYLLVFVGVLALADLIYQVYCQKRKENIQEKQEPSKTGVQETGRLILLDEEDQPVKSWDIAGRISILIGKSGGEDDVDVDLEDCAFSAFIDYEHAALNFCMEQWYIEDLGSQNGVRVRKADDGECYKSHGTSLQGSTRGYPLYCKNQTSFIVIPEKRVRKPRDKESKTDGKMYVWTYI